MFLPHSTFLALPSESCHGIRWLLSMLLLMLLTYAHGQILGAVSTLAGGAASGSANGLGTTATFSLPAGVSLNALGTVAFIVCIKKALGKGDVTQLRQWPLTSGGLWQPPNSPHRCILRRCDNCRGKLDVGACRRIRDDCYVLQPARNRS
jgi:hypothetical protein